MNQLIALQKTYSLTPSSLITLAIPQNKYCI